MNEQRNAFGFPVQEPHLPLRDDPLPTAEQALVWLATTLVWFATCGLIVAFAVINWDMLVDLVQAVLS